MSLFSFVKKLLPNTSDILVDDMSYTIVFDSFGVSFATTQAEYHCLNQGQGGGLQLVQHVLLKMLQERNIAEPLPNGFRIDSEEAVLLDPEDADALGLPECLLMVHLTLMYKGVRQRAVLHSLCSRS